MFGSEGAPTFSALRPLIRVQIISDNRLLRDSLARELDARDEFSVVGVSGGFAAPGMARGAHPEVAVLDATATDAEVVREVIDGSPGTQVVALGVADEERVVACAEAGVVGYVGAEGSLDDVTAAIEGASRGEPRCTPEVVAALLRRVAALAGASRPARHGLPTLTGREHQVVALIETGLSNKEIARRLHVEVATVKNHVHNILKKLDAKSRVEIVARVRQTRPVSPLAFADDSVGRTWTPSSPAMDRRRNPSLSPAEADVSTSAADDGDEGAGARPPVAARAGS